MLDVHPPEHTPHSWRDFFIHIATIVVGLLIAIGLEQTVEHFHHRHERTELEESVQVDSEKAIRDAESQQKDMVVALRWLDSRIEQVKDALKGNHALTASLPLPRIFEQDIPDDPAWKAAKSSGLIEVLPQDEIKVYSEIDVLISNLTQLLVPSGAVWRQRAQLESKFTSNGASIPDFSQASHQDLEQYLDLLLAMRSDTLDFNSGCGALLGAEQAIARGERDLSRIEQAERDRM